ncbi:MAG: lytic transglycosylase domain-containing protein [Chrysiogenales bacterium]|nr:MAG: lytic transglycosylase domain-containing protein [Chrysiogenales bacterium]
MIEDMYSVMKRINEIRGRFGLSAGRRAGEEAGPVSYQEHQDRVLAAGRADAGQAEPALPGNDVEGIRKLADRHAAEKHVPAALVRAVIETESNFDPAALSQKGAMGLMQLMPSVVSDFGVKDPFDPNENIGAGVSLLKELLDEYGGDYKKALAAYNAGRRAVNESGGVPNYPETREYVKKVIDSYMKNS